MEIEGPATEANGIPAMSRDDILKKFGSTVIPRLIKASRDTQFESEYSLLLNQVRMQWQFVRGNHYNVPGLVSTPYGTITDYIPFDFTQTNDTAGADIKLCPPINLIGGDLYKFMAVMGKAAPRVKGVPDDTNDSENVEAAKNADINIRDLWIKIKMDRVWKVVPFHLYVTGPCFLRAVWRTDATKYGCSTEPEIEIEETPIGPVPRIVGEKTYPNGDAEVEAYSVLEVVIPFNTIDLCDADFLKCEKMRSKWALLDKYADGGMLEEYRDGMVPDDEIGTGSSSDTATEAQDAVVEPSGMGQTQKANQWRHTEWWLRSHLYQAISDAGVRRIFQDHFPDGLYISRVGNITCEIDNRKVTDEWTVCRVGRSPQIMDRALSADAVPMQKTTDDICGMAIETVLRAITQTIMDAQLIDREAMSTKEAIPAEIILTAIPAGGDLNKQIFQIPPARLGDQVLPLQKFVRDLWTDIVGIRPEIAGGGETTQTYREAKQRRDMALAQLSPQADEMRFASESLAENLVKLRAKYGAGTVKAQRPGAYGKETDMADIADLKDSGWHAESDDMFPMLVTDERDAVFALLKDFPPEVQQALGVMDPMNIEQLCNLLQIPGFESAVKDQVEKNLGEIPGLLAEPPNGAQPSRPIDAYDNHIVAAAVFQKWLVSGTGQKAKNVNPQGFANVQAFWQAHDAASKPPMPPPPPPIKGSLGLTAKLEDFPNLVSEVLQGAGLPAPPAQAPAPAPNAVGPVGAPPASPAPSPSPIQQAAPIPNLPNGPGLPVQ